MSHYLEQQGFRTFAFQGEWGNLKQHLEKGRPLIVALKPGGHPESLKRVCTLISSEIASPHARMPSCAAAEKEVLVLPRSRKQLLVQLSASPICSGLTGRTSRTYSLRNIHVQQVYAAW
jgi:hypothetical protein